ncbi:hypothetical protein P9112_006875 [Eukaryota sp. TZLM1-RC]
MPRKRDIAWDYVIELSCDDSDPDCTINLDSPEVIPIEKKLYTPMCLLLLEVHSRFRYAHQRPYFGSSTRREKQHLCLHGGSPKNNNETFKYSA